MTLKRKEIIGIVGAGKVGIVLAQLAMKAGYTVNIAGSGDPARIALSVSVLAPSATPMTTKQLAENSDIIILALPLGKYQTLPRSALTGKLVLDATNYWWETDGKRAEFEQTITPSTQLIQNYLKDARVVKAFNHTGYHDLHDGPRQQGVAGRKAIAVAGNDENDIMKASEIVNNFGFDPVYVGTLQESLKLQPHGHIFGTNPSKHELVNLLSKSS